MRLIAHLRTLSKLHYEVAHGGVSDETWDVAVVVAIGLMLGVNVEEGVGARGPRHAIASPREPTIHHNHASSVFVKLVSP
jgi:hypothetical protein